MKGQVRQAGESETNKGREVPEKNVEREELRRKYSSRDEVHQAGRVNK
jgi:hypothetical protein